MKKMKWLRAAAILLGLFFTMAACQKQMDENTTPTLFGKWNIKSVDGASTVFGVRDTITYAGVPADYFEFTQSYICRIHFQGDDDPASFTLAGDTIMLARDEFPYKLKIVALTNQKLVLYSKARIDSLPFPQCYQEMIIHLEK